MTLSLLETASSPRATPAANPFGGRRREAATIRVLCAQRDVIGKIGGGEAASVRLLGQAIDVFVTWPVSQPPKGELPPNFEHVAVDMAFRSAIGEQLRSLPPELRTKDCGDFLEVVSIAHAVRGREFDVVECPDYLTYGRFLPFAFAEYGVKYKRLVCSLHGLLSRTFEIENQFHEVLPPVQMEHLRRAERQFVFGAADIRYGISERYVAQTRSLEPLPVALVDPLCALPAVRPSPVDARNQPRVWFVARQDRFKGADLFLAAVFRAGIELWDNYAMCGPSVRHGNRVSVFEGTSYCRNRGMPFHYRGALPYSEVVRQVYRGGALVVVPSREETFSLVALEALLNGTPVLISKHAGAADFIRRRFGAGFAGALEFDPFDESAAATAMLGVWGQLEEHRRAVRRALKEVDLTPQPDRLIEAYSSQARFNAELRDEAFRAWDRILKNLFLRQSASGAEQSIPQRDDNWQYLDLKDQNPIRTTRVDGKELFKLADAILDRSAKDNPLVSLHQARRLAVLSPHTNRARIYRHLAECEELSRPAVAAAYRLRAFRMGGLSGDELCALGAQLHRLGLREEEACFNLWSSQNSNSDWQITAYLEERRQRLLGVSLDAPEYIVERRDDATPRVSIIVSMYSAPKPVLGHFMKWLGEVAMVRDRRAEVVFIDSGSPAHQKELLESIAGLHGISHVLIRSVQRETIQTAWNRGLQMSRGDYITCLGVDEAVTEFALDELARFLDQHPETDWVTANTVVTQVDAQGNWKRDVMSYARPSYSRFNYLNDCTYINYVGGLYRRSLHTRFGWYDGTFKGAGDTEFKCRVFPFINTAALPKTLGFYFDFPAGRVTNSANIEVEDLRAWYVFRTRGGLEYLMGGQPAAAWEELFWTALSGRRCWSNTPVDCDLPFAANILAGLLVRDPSNPLRSLHRTLRAVVREMRLLQNWPARRAWLGAIAQRDLTERSRSFFRKCSKMRPDLNFPTDFRSDAFFFAHSWTW
jgi:glycosyltransferase involved in cell wall biosynthesis